MLNVFLFVLGWLVNELWKLLLHYNSLTWHAFDGLIFILAGQWLEQRQHLDFQLLNPTRGRGEDVQVALLLKGQTTTCLETPKEKNGMRR